jgi:shikimate kinase
MSLILLGYRGCGKTTLGRLLADRLWQPFADTDDLVVKSAGLSIADIFATHGETHFRDLESAALLAALRLEDHILSLGGGIVLRESNRLALQASPRKRIYLRCDPAVLSQRIAADPASAANRPPLTPDAPSPADLTEITRLLTQREPLYHAIATAELDVTHLSPQEALPHLVRMM